MPAVRTAGINPPLAPAGEGRPMTEAEWLACVDPRPMLEWLNRNERLSLRKIRLLFAACCSRIQQPLTEMSVQGTVELGERFPEGTGDPSGSVDDDDGPIAVADDSARLYLSLAAAEALQSVGGGNAGRVTLLRDLFGNPFRSAAVDLSWLSWQDGTVVKLAQSIYDERAFDRLPILADALEDAGCDNADILDHCRQPGEHVRGCWVIDLLLGKQ
jgi:hypothetical protein